MRLICPNCDAQYEVPDEVMPTSGRDVQCSNCGQTWFQHHPDHMPDEDFDGLDAAAPAPDEEVAPPPAPPSPPKPAPERKKLDPSVADILRQEAEAEQESRRRRQAETLESQPDLGLGDGDQPSEGERARLAKARTARLRGEETRSVSEAKATAAAVGSRRDLLPDIEEINSTLRSGTERRSSTQTIDAESDFSDYDHEERRGFGKGFLSVVVLMTLLVLIYVFALQIANAVPQADPHLSAYVAKVDAARLWLDGLLTGTLQWLDDKASQSGN